MNNKLKINYNSLIAYSIGISLILTYFFGLLVPVTSDAGKYAAISRIIYETGDWINLKIHFEPYLQKPPLIFWLTTPFYFIFGPTGFAFKLPVLLYSGIAIYSTYRFTKLFYSKKTAKIAAAMLAASEFYFLFHNDIHTDSILTANVIFSVWQLSEYFKSKKLGNILLSGLGIGLGLISKGPIGIFVPVTAALTHLIYKKQINLIFNYKVALGALVTLLVLAAGLDGIFNQFGWKGLKFFFWDNNVGRISGKIKGNSNDYLFYFHTTLYIFLPWSFLFFIVLFMEFKKIFKTKAPELFSLGGIFFYWIIISLAKA
ncbi:MAG: glycosyltransferase family 39 protein, partial [Prolixibacteraceae bacterium]|nr:glycosyltransferase family 39 protein [Prolixibacteraceae bacterium]